MEIDAVIIGASGYGGGELLAWLSRHPNVANLRGTSRSAGGKPFASAHPNLRGVVTGSFETTLDWKSLSERPHPVVFSALPHGELANQLAGLESEWAAAGLTERLTLIDLSGDFRSHDPAVFAKATGKPHPRPERLAGFAYGLPEWNRAALIGARRIASAGCFATALQLALLPWRGLDLGLVAASAVTGSCGSGTVASATTHHPTRASDYRAYKILSHQHEPEVHLAMVAYSITGTLSFVPQSGPFARGIFATLQFLKPPSLDSEAIRSRVAAAFCDAPFVRVLDESPRLAAVLGSNFADIHVAANEQNVVVLLALDNLGKGMATQAVQSMNIALGLPEVTGLWQAGRFPA